MPAGEPQLSVPDLKRDVIEFRKVADPKIEAPRPSDIESAARCACSLRTAFCDSVVRNTDTIERSS